jgi:outer membrane protein
VQAGVLPELNYSEMEAQLATDSSNLITAQSNRILSILLLKSILNIPADQPFEIDIPPVDRIPIEPLGELDPAVVFALAEKSMPQQKINDLNLQAAIKSVAAAKGRMYPSLALFGGLDTRYSNAQRLFGSDFVNTTIPIGFVDVNGTNYVVNTQQSIPTSFGKNTYFRQINNNFSQSIGLSLSIPIFNGGIARTNWKKAKLNVESAEIQYEGDAQTLKQDIYQAHANAVAAVQKLNAARKAVETAEKAYDFARKRFDIGLLNTIDLITNQNNLFRARINLLSAQYDYVFKMKLLEFYKGQGIKL